MLTLRLEQLSIEMFKVINGSTSLKLSTGRKRTIWYRAHESPKYTHDSPSKQLLGLHGRLRPRRINDLNKHLLHLQSDVLPKLFTYLPYVTTLDCKPKDIPTDRGSAGYYDPSLGEASVQQWNAMGWESPKSNTLQKCCLY